MGECNSVIPTSERDEDLIAAAQIVVRKLEKKKIFTRGQLEILLDLGTRLCSMAKIIDGKVENKEISSVEERLNFIHDKIMKWEEDQTMIWERDPEVVREYVKDVDEARKLSEELESLNLTRNGDVNELLRKSHDVLHTAMTRVEEEFRHMLVENRQTFEPEHVSFRSNDDDVAEDFSRSSFGDESTEESLQRDSLSRGAEEYIIDLVDPCVIPDLKCIANLMFESGYGRECTQAFISVRTEALRECLFILEVEKVSIEDVVKMEWNSLNSKIGKWIWAIKRFVRIYLASERSLSDQIFGQHGSVGGDCFCVSSKASMLQLLNFAEAIAIGPHQPEKLIRILDMYEILTELTLDIEALYSDDSGFSMRTECQGILCRLGDCVKATFLKFENAVASNVSQTPFPGGGIHHLTRYVMNFLRNLTDYGHFLNHLLSDNDKESSILSSTDITSVDESHATSLCVSQLSSHFRSLMSVLESNLEEKSKLYKDNSLGHIFLMNNIQYMAQKAYKCSELRTVLGDEWIRKCNWKFQQHELNYERSTWSSILSLLKDEGLYHHDSNSVSTTLLKERLHLFYLAFEEIYKNQTAWSIPDIQLREDLHISLSLKVIQGYRTFIGRHHNHISDKFIKYSPDDLQDYIMHLFEGSPRSLHSFHRK